jgi:Ser/Thr protein kinase RdoA (MazF antagonist)
VRDDGPAVTAAEETLSSGGVTHVVRIGQTVRRPARPFTATVQTYLSYVRSRGFTDCPEPLGRDARGREVLSYVAGDVPVEPLPSWAASSEALETLGALIRRLHDAADGWVPPADAVWGGIPGVRPAGVRPLFDQPELVSHMDYCPGNVVFHGGRPVALIDFDLARPTTRVADLVNALYWWAPLVDPMDRAASLVDADVPARVRAFADAYGMTAEQRAQVSPVANRMVANVALTSRAAAEADPVFRRWWDDGLKDRLPRAVEWLASATGSLDAAL